MAELPEISEPELSSETVEAEPLAPLKAEPEVATPDESELSVEPVEFEGSENYERKCEGGKVENPITGRCIKIVSDPSGFTTAIDLIKNPEEGEKILNTLTEQRRKARASTTFSILREQAKAHKRLELTNKNYNQFADLLQKTDFSNPERVEKTIKSLQSIASFLNERILQERLKDMDILQKNLDRLDRESATLKFLEDRIRASAEKPVDKIRDALLNNKKIKVPPELIHAVFMHSGVPAKTLGAILDPKTGTIALNQREIEVSKRDFATISARIARSTQGTQESLAKLNSALSATVFQTASPAGAMEAMNEFLAVQESDFEEANLDVQSLLAFASSQQGKFRPTHPIKPITKLDKQIKVLQSVLREAKKKQPAEGVGRKLPAVMSELSLRSAPELAKPSSEATAPTASKEKIDISELSKKVRQSLYSTVRDNNASEISAITATVERGQATIADALAKDLRAKADASGLPEDILAAETAEAEALKLSGDADQAEALAQDASLKAQEASKAIESELSGLDARSSALKDKAEALSDEKAELQEKLNSGDTSPELPIQLSALNKSIETNRKENASIQQKISAMDALLNRAKIQDSSAERDSFLQSMQNAVNTTSAIPENRAGDLQTKFNQATEQLARYLANAQTKLAEGGLGEISPEYGDYVKNEVTPAIIQLGKRFSRGYSTFVLAKQQAPTYKTQEKLLDTEGLGFESEVIPASQGRFGCPLLDRTVAGAQKVKENVYIDSSNKTIGNSFTDGIQAIVYTGVRKTECRFILESFKSTFEKLLDNLKKVNNEINDFQGLVKQTGSGRRASSKQHGGAPTQAQIDLAKILKPDSTLNEDQKIAKLVLEGMRPRDAKQLLTSTVIATSGTSGTGASTSTSTPAGTSASTSGTGASAPAGISTSTQTSVGTSTSTSVSTPTQTSTHKGVSTSTQTEPEPFKPNTDEAKDIYSSLQYMQKILLANINALRRFIGDGIITDNARGELEARKPPKKTEILLPSQTGFGRRLVGGASEELKKERQGIKFFITDLNKWLINPTPNDNMKRLLEEAVVNQIPQLILKEGQNQDPDRFTRITALKSILTYLNSKTSFPPELLKAFDDTLYLTAEEKKEREQAKEREARTVEFITEYTPEQQEKNLKDAYELVKTTISEWHFPNFDKSLKELKLRIGRIKELSLGTCTAYLSWISKRVNNALVADIFSKVNFLSVLVNLEPKEQYSKEEDCIFYTSRVGEIAKHYQDVFKTYGPEYPKLLTASLNEFYTLLKNTDGKSDFKEFKNAVGEKGELWQDKISDIATKLRLEKLQTTGKIGKLLTGIKPATTKFGAFFRDLIAGKPVLVLSTSYLPTVKEYIKDHVDPQNTIKLKIKYIQNLKLINVDQKKTEEELIQGASALKACIDAKIDTVGKTTKVKDFIAFIRSDTQLTTECGGNNLQIAKFIHKLDLSEVQKNLNYIGQLLAIIHT